jgi:hypothetical protein
MVMAGPASHCVPRIAQHMGFWEKARSHPLAKENYLWKKGYNPWQDALMQLVDHTTSC